MEKPKPTHDLDAFKAAVRSTEGIEITVGAVQGARALGLDEGGLSEVLKTMERRHFYKSMTSYGDHRLWQDVYHVPWAGKVLYVKFSAGRLLAFRLLSSKER